MPAPSQNPDGPFGTPAQEPLFSVGRGNPTAAELAAVTAVVLALQGGAAQARQGHNARHWARRARLHLPPAPGAGAWRRSAK